MLLSTPLSLLLSISALKGADEVVVERQFNAVIIRCPADFERRRRCAHQPSTFFVGLDGSRGHREFAPEKNAGPPKAIA